MEPEYSILGLIHDIHVDDDGLVRQILSAQQVGMQVVEDNRNNRNVPVEISVIFLDIRTLLEFITCCHPGHRFHWMKFICVTMKKWNSLPHKALDIFDISCGILSCLRANCWPLT